MKRKILIYAIGTAVVAASFLAYAKAKPVVAAAKSPPHATKASAPIADLTAYGFSATKEIRYDESMGTKKPTPHIPPGWRLVSVANGSAPNAANLWFVDGAGNVYMLQGFTARDGGEFILYPQVQTLRPN